MIDPDLLAALDADESRKAIEARFGTEAGRWASVQAELRAKARTRFGPDAARMLFVREALEQATHPAVAEYHASRFPAGTEVVDLTCGIGSDLIALSRRGPAIGYEIDPERAGYAGHNLGPDTRIVAGDGLEVEPTDYAWADPARRSEGRRLTDAEAYAPPLSALALRARRLMGIKLSPLLPDAVLEGLGGGLEFVSHGGECREAVVWLGSEAEPGRWAVQIGRTIERLPAALYPESASEPGAFLHEADPAAIRAHVLGGFGLDALGDTPGYLTGDEPLVSPWLRSYTILAHGAFDSRRVKEELRRLSLRVFEVKRRGVPDAVDTKARALIGKTEGRPASIVLYAQGPSARYLLASAVEPSLT